MKGKIKMINLDVDSKEHFEIYLFGSAVYSENPGDLDLAIIYDSKFVGIEEAIVFRRNLLSKLKVKSNLPVDTILLSKDEEIECNFLKNAKHILLNKNYTQHNK